jgi:hypothetical protein
MTEFLSKLLRQTLQKVLVQLYYDRNTVFSSGLVQLRTDVMIEAIERILGGKGE